MPASKKSKSETKTEPSFAFVTESGRRLITGELHSRDLDNPAYYEQWECGVLDEAPEFYDEDFPFLLENLDSYEGAALLLPFEVD